MGEIHLAGLVRICLHQHRHLHVSQCDDRAILVAEVGKRKNDTIVLPFMLGQEGCESPALLRRLNRVIACARALHYERLMAVGLQNSLEIPDCGRYKLTREESPVSKIYRKPHI